MTRAVELIKQFEGLRLKAYRDARGTMTIGYGHTGAGVLAGIFITEEQANRFLEQDIAWATDTVRRAVRVTLTVEQRAALISLTFNIGSAGLRKSTVLRRLNAGNYEGAADAILMWNKITVAGKKVVLSGLKNRREQERAVFLSGTPTELKSAAGATVTGGEAKPMIRSKTQWWAGLGLGGVGLTGVLPEILSAFGSIEKVVPDVILTVGPLVLLGVIFIAIMINRLIDSRKGVH